jgi:hypothetical protein
MPRRMRPLPTLAARSAPALLAVLALAGCALEPVLAPAAVLGGASLVFTGKTPVDHLAGWVTGQDCSAVRLETRGPWCVALAPLPGPAPFCTRSLGGVDCWTAPPPGAPRLGVADPGR